MEPKTRLFICALVAVAGVYVVAISFPIQILALVFSINAVWAAISGITKINLT